MGLEMRTGKYACNCHLKTFLLSGNLKNKNFETTCVNPNPRSIPYIIIYKMSSTVIEKLLSCFQINMQNYQIFRGEMHPVYIGSLTHTDKFKF